MVCGGVLSGCPLTGALVDGDDDAINSVGWVPRVNLPTIRRSFMDKASQGRRCLAILRIIQTSRMSSSLGVDAICRLYFLT